MALSRIPTILAMQDEIAEAERMLGSLCEHLAETTTAGGPRKDVLRAERNISRMLCEIDLLRAQCAEQVRLHNAGVMKRLQPSPLARLRASLRGLGRSRSGPAGLRLAR